MADYSLATMRAIAMFEVFRRMGFPSDDIFFEFTRDAMRMSTPDRAWACFVRLTQGERVFRTTVATGLSEAEIDALRDEAMRAAEDYNAQRPPFDDLDALNGVIRETLDAFGGVVSLAAALAAKGIVPPKEDVQWPN